MVKVIIFGGHCYGERVNYSLDDAEYKVIAYADNDKKIWGKLQNGVKIIAPNDIKKEEFDYIIIAYGMYETDIRKQLVEELGIDNNKIVTFQPEFKEIKWQESRIAMLKRCIDVLKERGIKGNTAELGVYKGEFAKLINRYLPDRKLYLFDTFEGFNTERDKENVENKSLFKDTSVDLVLEKMKTPENCIVKKGYFPDTASDVEDKFCLVSLDPDLYLPMLNGLKFFYPRLNKGGYIFIHDFGNHDWEGCKKAVYEFCEESGAAFVPILDRCGSIVITK